MLSKELDTLDLAPAHFIGGRKIPASGAMPLVRACDGTHYADCAIADANVVDAAVACAKAAWRDSGWGRMRPRGRRDVLCRWADLIEADAPLLGRLECAGSTRLIGQVTQDDIAVTAEQIRFFAEMADKEGGDLAPTADDTLGMIVDEPYGVVGAITPWNFPVSMAGWKLGPALAAGNAVVVKPSEMTPFSTLRLAELAVQAGLAPGLLNVVTGDGQTTGTALTGHPDIGKISFTGSTLAGRAIMSNIARNGVKPMTLELGGKSPQVVFADADLEVAARAIAASITYNAGQACVAGTRVVVQRPMADALIERLLAHLATFRPGDTLAATTTYSPIISEKQLARIDRLVQSAHAQGGQCLIGGRRFDAPGCFYEPTLIIGASAPADILREEVFGPVLTLECFDDEAQALALASHETYGLAAGIYTRDLSRALRVMSRLEAGTIWINRYGRSRDHILSTGGFRQSGFGKDLGRDAYHANRRRKSVLVQL